MRSSFLKHVISIKLSMSNDQYTNLHFQMHLSLPYLQSWIKNWESNVINQRIKVRFTREQAGWINDPISFISELSDANLHYQLKKKVRLILSFPIIKTTTKTKVPWNWIRKLIMMQYGNDDNMKGYKAEKINKIRLTPQSRNPPKIIPFTHFSQQN